MRFLARIFGGLKGRTFLALLLISTLAGFSVGGASYYIARSLVRDQVSRNLANIGQDVREVIEKVWIPTLRREMQVLAEVAGRLYMEGSRPESLRSALEQAEVKVPGFRRLNVFLPNGIFLASTDPAYRGRAEEGLAGLAPGETGIVPFRRVGDPPQEEILMTVGAPISAGGNVIAVLAGDLTPEGVGGELASLSVGLSGEVYLVDAEGRLLTLPPRAAEETGLELLGNPLDTEGVRRATAGESGVSEYLNYEGRRVLGSHSFIPELGWGVMVEEDAQRAFADLASLRNGIVLIVLGLALASLLASFLLAGRLAAPLLRLQRGAEKLGLGDLSYRVKIGGSEEMRALATGFNRMADALQSSHQALEEKVRERTAELRILNEMISSMRRSMLPEEILQRALRAGMDITAYEIGWCYLLSGESLRLLYRRCPAERAADMPETVSLQEGFLGEIARKGEAAILDAPQGVAGEIGIPRDVGSFAALPLRSPTRTLGLLCLAAGDARPLPEDMKRTLGTLADEVGTALENALLYRELQAHVEELERANRELRSLDEMKSNFISAVTHELKQPLSLIAGHAQTIYDYYESLTYDEELHSLRVIMERTRFLSSLVDDLLDLSLLEMGRIRLQKEVLDLPALARRVAGEYAGKVTEQPLVVDFPRDFPPVVADARRLEQVLSNLLSNAVKFSRGKGEIRIQGLVGDDRVQVKVMDEGIGIDPAQLHRIFDRFYQADASLRRSYAGVGLGLFICRQLVEAHGGRIWAENRPGGGAVFTFEIPLAT
ncbi:MAG: GAF domain-containing protein [Actinobacteria bacterium]|nr:GAF domain-containing protein [Actinomycetota bacterium]